MLLLFLKKNTQAQEKAKLFPVSAPLFAARYFCSVPTLSQFQVPVWGTVAFCSPGNAAWESGAYILGVLKSHETANII